MFELVITDVFAGAHSLRDYDGECENLHGHNWRVEVTLKSGRLDDIGMVFDFKKVKNILREVLSRFDHSHLNELKEFSQENPTTENVSRILFNRLGEKLPAGISVAKVKTWESDNCAAAYYE
ncbi:MAG: 6-carboxytetrahydropterin synthase QueD [Planctomycetes bacterium]|nr:6-carboxytetrahydropterin synthase QueD [Planctomycetota bacterium]